MYTIRSGVLTSVESIVRLYRSEEVTDSLARSRLLLRYLNNNYETISKELESEREGKGDRGMLQQRGEKKDEKEKDQKEKDSKEQQEQKVPVLSR